MTYRYLLAALIFAGSGCSLIKSKLPSSVTAHTSTAEAAAARNSSSPASGSAAESKPAGASTTAMAPVKKVEVSDKEPKAVRDMAARLDWHEEKIRTTGLPPFDPRFVYEFFIKPAEELTASPRYAELKKRVQDLDVAYAKAVGERASKLVGDAHRSTEATKDELAVAKEALDLCKKAGDMVIRSADDAAYFKTREKAYVDAVETLLARAPRALHHAGDVDMVRQFLTCEGTLAGVYAQMADTYVPEPAAVAEYDRGCATQVIELSAEKVGSGWGSWGITSLGRSMRVPCGKLAKKTTAPKDAVKDLLARGADGSFMKGDVLVQQGKVDFWNDDETIPPRPHKTIVVVRHGRKVPILKNPCGADDLACEAGGSMAATALNRTRFYLERADAYRGSGNAESCQHFIKAAEKSSKDFLEKYEFDVKLGQWVKNLRYKTRAGDVLSEAQVLENFRQAQKTAADRKLGFCTASK